MKKIVLFLLLVIATSAQMNAQQYDTYVRGWCVADSMWGEWSEPHIFSLDDTIYCDDTEDIPSLGSHLDQFTNLFPNPAQDHVQVFSSFGLRGVEACTLDGRCVLNIPVHGLTASFSTAS